MRKLAILVTAATALLAFPALSGANNGAATPASPGLVDPLPDPGPLCGDQIFEQPFLDWNDLRDYTLAPNGSFESGLDGWIVSDGVEVRPHGNWFRPDAGTSALFMPPDSSAVSPPICVTPDYPAARLFGKTLTSGPSAASLRVKVIFPPTEAGGEPKAKPAGTLRRERTWDATRKFAISPGQVARAAGPDGTTMIRLRFATRDASWLLDDLLVDPRAR
jgi:hypothetical protein